MICELKELPENPGHWECVRCGVHTPSGMSFEKAPFRPCPADPIGVATRRRMGLPPFERPSVPDGFSEDLAELGVEPQEVGQNSLASLYLRWHKAILTWRKAGSPVRNKEEMAECLAVCKSPCKFYDTRIAGFAGYCTVCGCGVSGVPIGELNKIRMATEKCPKGKWE